MANSVLDDVGKESEEERLWRLYEESQQLKQPSLASRLEGPAAALGGQYAGSQAAQQLGLLGSSEASGAAATPGIGASLAAAAPYAGVIAGGALLAQGAKDLKEGKSGDPLSRAQTGWTTGGLSEIARLFQHGKQKDQISRDKVRAGLLNSGFLDNSYNIALPGGQTFNIGRDGGDPAYNVDFKREGADQAVGLSNPLAVIVTGGDKKLTNDFAGYFANAAMEGGDPLANARAMYERAGFKDANSAYKALDALRDKGVISPEDHAAYRNGVATVFGANKKSGGGSKGGSSSGGGNSSGGRPQKTPKVPAPPNLPPPTVDQRIADAYRAVFDNNQMATGRNPLLENPLLAIPSPRRLS